MNKPGGILVQPTSQEPYSLLTELRKEYRFIEPIHRIDKPVSGVVVFAKSSKALPRLMKEIRERRTRKRYLALVAKKPFHLEGTLIHKLVHGDHKAYIDESGKESKLSYKFLEDKGPYFLLSIDLETGRYHQIRAQMAAIGCPIVGDAKYGSKVFFKEGVIALHHAEMSIAHPITHEIMTFIAPSVLNKSS
ncbi:MAG: RNA pseudouridine synthase [Chlamydiota bacterium]